MTDNPAHSTAIEEGLQRAYRETEYQVQVDPVLVLRVGHGQPELMSLHARHAVSSSAFITACNPYSQTLDLQDNATRQAMLAQELTFRSLAFLPGLGVHPSGLWPAEPSFLVFGIDLAAAKALGQRFEQNAVVWTGTDGVPQLVLLR